MKKIYCISAFLLGILALSCTRETFIEEPAMEEATVPVVLSFSQPVVLQASTKAEPGMEMGLKPAITDIHVAIFGTDRYLKDYVSAYPCDANGDPLSSGYVSENGTTAYFMVRLPISSKPRVMHVIANGPATLPFNAYENDIMQNLTVSEGNGAYWQRIELTDGITIKETDGVPMQKPNGDYIPSDALAASVSGITLIRNFASITLTESADNFEIVSYTLCNMPRSGAVAMYSTNHGDWVTDYADPDLALTGRLYNYLDPDDNMVKTYLGFPTDPEIDTTVPTTVDAYNAPGVTVGPGEPYYVYERAVTSENPPFILMAARYKASGEPTSATPISYYRLDLAMDSGYFPIYRNFSYLVNVSGVTAEGYDNPADAAAHNSGSNFSVSLDTRSLPEVSNGIVRLFVQHANYDWVYNTDEQQFGFRFTLNGSSSGTLNDYVTVTHKEGNAINSLRVDSDDDAEDFRYVHYRMNQPDGTSTLSSTVQLEGLYSDGGTSYRLVRLITIRVFNAKTVQPYFTPFAVANEAAQRTILNIPLPWDLQASMFPMEILIEDSAKVLNPAANENMPVKTTGINDPDAVFTSLSGDGSSSYCFVRTLNWSEYLRLKTNAELSGTDDIVLTCEFETTKAFTSTTVYVYNKYFVTDSAGITTAQATLTGDPDNNITPNRQTISGTTANVRVKCAGNWELSIALLNGSVASGATLNPSSGSATTGQDVVVTLPENVTENAIRYRVTLTNTSANPPFTRTALMTQEGTTMHLTTSVTSVDNASNLVNVAVQSGVRYVIELLDENNNVLSTSAEYDPTLATVNRTVLIPQNQTFSERQLTIRVRNLLSTIWKDVTITQEAAFASLTVRASEVPMSAVTAPVYLRNSFPVKLRVYNNDTNELVSTSEEFVKSVTAVLRNVTIDANSGSATTYRVEIWRTDESERIGNSITFVQKPSILITAASTSVKGDDNTTLSIISDVDWVLTVTGGATLSTYSGTATSGTGQTVTLTMPVNYSTAAAQFTITAQGTGENASMTSSVTVTHRGVTLREGQTVTFPCGSGRTYSSSVLTDTRNGITATFEGTLNSTSSTNHLRFGSGTGLHFTTDNTKIYDLTGATFTFTGDSYRPTGGTASNGTWDWATTSTWTKSGTAPVTSLDVSFTRRYTTFRLSSFTVTYTGYEWN